ncbi:MAG: MarR family transcriptional regulator [Pseudomonadota bacterium]
MAAKSKARPSVDVETLTLTLRPENNPGFLLWQVTNLWQRRQRANLDSVGITHVQFILLAGLAWLDKREGHVNQARLAQFCKTDPMMTSQVVRTLATQGLLERDRHPTDGRARHLKLTAAGARVLNEAMPLVLEADAQFFDSLAEDQPTLIDALRRLWHAAQTETPPKR